MIENHNMEYGTVVVTGLKISNKPNIHYYFATNKHIKTLQLYAGSKSSDSISVALLLSSAVT